MLFDIPIDISIEVLTIINKRTPLTFGCTLLLISKYLKELFKRIIKNIYTFLSSYITLFKLFFNLNNICFIIKRILLKTVNGRYHKVAFTMIRNIMNNFKFYNNF